MGIMIVDARPVKVGKFAVRLRVARDGANSLHSQPVPPQAAKDYDAFVTAPTTAKKLERLKNASIKEKINTSADSSDNEAEDITGDEVSVIFDDEPTTPQTVAAKTTIMVVPSATDLVYLLGVGGIYTKSDRSKISEEDYAELGRYLLKRCR